MGHTCCPSVSAIIFSVSSRRPSRSDINVRDCNLLVSVAAVTCASSNLRRTYSSSEATDAVADAVADAEAEVPVGGGIELLFVDDDIIFCSGMMASVDVAEY